MTSNLTPGMISLTNLIIAGFTYIYPRKGEIRFCFRVFVLEPLEKHWFEGLRSDKNIKIILYINFYFIWLGIHDSSNVVDFRHLKFDKNSRKSFPKFKKFWEITKRQFLISNMASEKIFALATQRKIVLCRNRQCKRYGKKNQPTFDLSRKLLATYRLKL